MYRLTGLGLQLYIINSWVYSKAKMNLMPLYTVYCSYVGFQLAKALSHGNSLTSDTTGQPPPVRYKHASRLLPKEEYRGWYGSSRE